MMRRAMLALAVSGCSVLPQRPYLEKREWPLAIRRPAPRPPRTGGRVLVVRTLSVAPGLEARGLQRLQADGSVRTDYYEEWSVPPADAVEDSLRRWLADSGLFAAVVASGSRARADLALEGQLTALAARPGSFHASLATVLIDLRPNPARVLFQAQDAQDIPLADPSSAAVAAAGNAALAGLCAAVENRVARLA
jgi:cholesterol transport system auxiliary component